MEHMTKRLAPTLLAIGALALTAGCGGGKLGGTTSTGASTGAKAGAPAAGTSNATLRYVMSAEPVSLDPAVGTDSQSAIMFRNVYDRMIELAPNGHDLVPGLAEKWEVADDKTTYTFHLRQGVKFDDGTAMDANAVVYSLQRVLGIGKGDASLLAGHTTAKDITAPDPQTVQIVLKKPYAPFLQIIALFDIGSVVNPQLVKAHATAKDKWGEKYMKTHMSGTGPFKLVAWKRNQSVELSRSDTTWQSKAKLAGLRFTSPGEGSTAMLNLRRGDTDIIDPNVLGGDQIASLSKAQGIKVEKRPIYDAVYWVMNVTKPPFDDPKVRQAISYAMDYDGIISGVVQSQGTRLGGPLPQGLLGDVPAPVYNHDVDKAKALLAEAGKKDLKITSWYVDFGPLKAIAQVMQSNLQAAGIKVQLREVPLSTLLDGVTSGRLAFYSWSSNPPFASPDPILYNHYYSKSGNGVEGNLSHYTNPEVDGLLTQARAETDQKASDGSYRQAAEKIAQDAPAVYLAQTVKNAPMRSAVQGYQIVVIGGASFRDVSLGGS